MSDQDKTKAQKLEIVKKQLEEELQLENFGVTKEQLDNIAEIICNDNRFFAYLADANSLDQTNLLDILSKHNMRLRKLEINKKLNKAPGSVQWDDEVKIQKASDKANIALLFAAVSLIFSVASIWLS